MSENKTKKELNINDYEIASTTNSYTPEMLKDISKHSNAITTALNSIAKNYEKVIFNLYWIYKTKSYVSFGYDSILTYASEKFGFKKSSTYDFINLAERFGNDNYTAFDAKYKDYEHSKLSLIADKSDFEINDLKINPDMSVKEIKALVKKHDSVSKSVQDSKDNESGSDSEKSDSQESLVIKENNEVSLSNFYNNSSLSFLDYESYEPDMYYDLYDNNPSYGWALSQVVYDYLDNYMTINEKNHVTYGADNIIDAPSSIAHTNYKAVIYENKCVVRFFFGSCIFDISFKRLEYEKIFRHGILVTVHQNKKKVKSVIFKTIDRDILIKYLKDFSDCKITIISNNSNDNKEKGGKDNDT